MRCFCLRILWHGEKYKNCNQHSLREIQTENYTANAYFARRRVYCMSVSWRDSDRTMLLVLALSKRRIYTMRLVCFWQKEKKKQYNIPMAFYQSDTYFRQYGLILESWSWSPILDLLKAVLYKIEKVFINVLHIFRKLSSCPSQQYLTQEKNIQF